MSINKFPCNHESNHEKAVLQLVCGLRTLPSRSCLQAPLRLCSSGPTMQLAMRLQYALLSPVLGVLVACCLCKDQATKLRSDSASFDRDPTAGKGCASRSPADWLAAAAPLTVILQPYGQLPASRASKAPMLNPSLHRPDGCTNFLMVYPCRKRLPYICGIWPIACSISCTRPFNRDGAACC